jgi:hypothetical protein
MGQSISGEACWPGGLAPRLRAALGPLGAVDAGPADLAEMRALAARLIGPDIASEETLAAIFARTGYGFYVVREEGAIAAVLALIMLNDAGLSAMQRGSFDTLSPHPIHACGPFEAPVAVYGWGVAGSSRETAHAIAEACRTARAAAPELPFFARAATDAGRRLLMEKMAFRPYPGSMNGVLWWAPYDGETRRAA